MSIAATAHGAIRGTLSGNAGEARRAAYNRYQAEAASIEPEVEGFHETMRQEWGIGIMPLRFQQRTWQSFRMNGNGTVDCDDCKMG